MSHFLDSIAARQMVIGTDSWTVGPALGNGDTIYQESGSQGRSYSAIDSAAGAEAAYMPNWGVTDYGIHFLLRRGANLNPGGGFSTYHAFHFTNAAFNTFDMVGWALDDDILQVTIDGCTSNLQMLTVDVYYHYVIGIESSNLVDGVRTVWRNGRRIGRSPHGIVAAPSRTTDRFEWGGQNGASEFGVLGQESIGKLLIQHALPTDAQVRSIADTLRLY